MQPAEPPPLFLGERERVLGLGDERVQALVDRAGVAAGRGGRTLVPSISRGKPGGRCGVVMGPFKHHAPLRKARVIDTSPMTYAEPSGVIPMRYLLPALAALAVAGCDGGSRYKGAMVTPAPTAAPMTFEDDTIKATFAIDNGQKFNGFAWVASCTGVDIELQNKTDQAITIDWNKVAYKDPSGASGNAITHKGVAFAQASAPKAPTSLPAHQTLSDVITPCAAISYYTEGRGGWAVDLFPGSPQHAPFGVYLPLDIGGKVKEYSFDFVADSDAPPPAPAGSGPASHSSR